MEIRELKMALKSKQEELSEMCIRKELVEKKLFNINKDRDNEAEKLKVLLFYTRYYILHSLEYFFLF